MTLGVLAHHALLVAAVAGLGGAGVRVASRIGATGVERALVAFTLACAAAVCASLGLGLVSLGGSSLALGVAAIVTWAVAARCVERPAVSVRSELATWSAAADGRWVAGLGALGGLAVA
jgi:hypothetical protein